MAYRHVHLHVISEDRISPSYKTKKHHNSFRPDLGFFITIMEVQRWLQQDKHYLYDRIDVSPLPSRSKTVLIAHLVGHVIGSRTSRRPDHMLQMRRTVP